MILRDMFYASKGGYPDDLEAGPSSDPPVLKEKEPPVAKAHPSDRSSHFEGTGLPLKENRSLNASTPVTQNLPELSQTQPHVDATSLYAFALGTFPTSLLLLIVLRGIPPRGRDSRTPHVEPAIPASVVTYLDFLDRQQAPLSPQFTDGEYTASLFSDSNPPSPLHDGEPLDGDVPTTPTTPGTPGERVPDARDPREAALDEWELAFVSLLLGCIQQATLTDCPICAYSGGHSIESWDPQATIANGRTTALGPRSPYGCYGE